MRLLLVFIPIILAAVLPIAFMISCALVPETPPYTFPQSIRNILFADTSGMHYAQLMFSAFNKLVCPMLFLSITIICSVSAASCSFILEKENLTMETLLLSAMNHKSILNAKVSVSVIFSTMLSLISFIVFMITMIVGGSILNLPFFFNIEWFLILFLVMPALSLFCTVFISLLGPFLKTMGEALQTIGHLIFIIAIFYLLQAAGVWNINTLFLLVFAILLLVADFILYNKAVQRFTPEIILQQNNRVNSRREAQ